MKAAPPAGTRRLDLIDVDEMVAAIRNPKMHDLDALMESLRTYGYGDTVLLDERTARTISGHGRIEAIQALRDKGEDPPDGVAVKGGRWLIPVVRGWASDGDAHAEGYLLAANRQGELGGWDSELLKQMVADLAEYDEELLRAAGYDELDQHEILRDHETGKGQAPPDEFPSYGSGIAADYRCPSCGHEWNGEARP